MTFHLNESRYKVFYLTQLSKLFSLIFRFNEKLRHRQSVQPSLVVLQNHTIFVEPSKKLGRELHVGIKCAIL